MSDLLSHFETQIQTQEQLLREREQEIEQLRRQRDRLAELTQKRDELHAQLRAVEGDIALIERTMTSSLHRFGTRFDAPAAPAAAPRPPESPPAPAEEPRPATLKDEIRAVLRASRGPVNGPDIADRIRANGYRTASANFPNVVKKHLGEMDDVAHVRGEGYRLKKA